MALEDVMSGIGSVLSVVAGLYLFSFRPPTRPAIFLGAYAVLSGMAFLVLSQGNLYPFHIVSLGATVAGLVFILTFPAAFPRKAFSVFMVGAAAAWFVITTMNLVAGRLPSSGTYGLDDQLLSPGGAGGAIILTLALLARLVDLGAARDPPARAARLLLLTPLLIVFVGGGQYLGQVVGGALDLTEYPSFLYASSEDWRTVVGSLQWWGITIPIAAYALARPRWALPGLLMLAGFVTFLPSAFRPDLDATTRTTLRLWGTALTPAFIMYTQARYRPFEGEPIGLRPTLVATVVAGFLAYLFAFVASLIVVPGQTGLILGASLGIIAAVGTARAAFPHLRRDELRNLFAPAGGSVGASAALDPGRVVLGRYRITRLIAEGGQGRVYEATDRLADARVVLKAMTSDGAFHEARVLDQVKHKNIVRLVDHVEIPGLTLLVLEHIPGGDLRQLLARRGGKLSTSEALGITRGVLEGLAAAHAQGVAHRDVKPENLLLSDDGTPKVIDFGVARGAVPGATVRIASLGTLAYLAPEQARGEPGDARSDVYAIAVLCHELLTGRRPVEPRGDDAVLVRRSIQMQAPRLSLPPAATHLTPLLERALAKTPEERYQTAGEMLAALPKSHG